MVNWLGHITAIIGFGSWVVTLLAQANFDTNIALFVALLCGVAIGLFYPGAKRTL